VELRATTNAASLAIPDALLVSALRNLLDNALRHSPKPGSVVLRVERLPGHVAFRVLDEGPGMSAAEVAQAAQRFWRRGSGNVDGDTGSGLGLSIVDAIARRYGGELHLEPRRVAGMEARLCFPAEE
jgi:signal transduction histidine kinase